MCSDGKRFELKRRVWDSELIKEEKVWLFLLLPMILFCTLVLADQYGYVLMYCGNATSHYAETEVDATWHGFCDYLADLRESLFVKERLSCGDDEMTIESISISR